MSKWILILVLLGAGLAARAAEFAGVGEWRQSLDGAWQFTTDPAVAEPPAGGAWEPITVPGNWDVLPAHSTHKGKGWYRRSFTVPAGWKGKRLRLRFEAVYHDAAVTLNGKELGRHVGGYTPFEFDVTDQVTYAGDNVLLVCADNSYQRGAWWHWGGISRSVNLIANNDVRIVWQHVRTEPDLAAGSARIFVQYKLANAGTTPLAITLQSAIDGVVEPKLAAAVTVAASSESMVALDTLLPKERVRLWHFDQPNLYRLTTEIAANGTVLHGQADRFGIRQVEVKPDGLYLNGEKIRVPGFNRVSDSRQFGNTEPDELVRLDVDLMKRCGAVFARLMHVPQAPNLLDYLDEKGMMIFAEIPVWGSDDPQVKKDNPLTKQWLAEMVARDYNHPCIIGWSPGNEIVNHYTYVESMNAYIRSELDPHRLVAYVSYTAARGNATPQNDPVTVSDIAMINVYSGKPESFSNAAKTLRARWPGKPVFFSEYGVGQIGASPQSMVPKGKEIWKEISSNPAVIGGALWTFNDYRSGYKGTPASGNREWGIVDELRHPKAAYEQVRQLYSPVRSLTLADGIIRIEPRGTDEIPSYTLRGYQVKWTLLDGVAKTIQAGVVAVPELKPGSATWTAPLPADPAMVKAAALVTLSLISPTGYAVADYPAPAAPVAAAPAAGPDFDLGAMIRPVPASAVFRDPDYNIWCGTMVRGDDGKCHLFYSRWPRRLGHSAWLTHSEVAHAIADNPLGPYKHVDVALPVRGKEFWDGLNTHNPTVQKFGGKYYLYYTGTTGNGIATKELNWTHRNNQRIGVAVADSLNGPWTRFDKPLVDVSPDPAAPDALMMANPAVTQRPDGGYLMVYKAVAKKGKMPFGGPVVHLVATSDNPTGPFKKNYTPIFTKPGEHFAAEDPFIWHDGERYRAVVKDFHGIFTGRGCSLALFESVDGFDWKPSKNVLVSTLQITWEDGKVQKLDALERPQVWQENGKPAVLFCAVAEKAGRDGSFNVAIPLAAPGKPKP